MIPMVPKTLAITLFAMHFSCVLSGRSKYPVSQGKHHIAKGERVMVPSEDTVLFNDHPAQSGGSWMSRTSKMESKCYPPMGSTDNVKITRYEVHDEETGTDGGVAFVTSGDINMNQVCFVLKSQKGKGYRFAINVYGIRESTPAQEKLGGFELPAEEATADDDEGEAKKDGEEAGEKKEEEKKEGEKKEEEKKEEEKKDEPRKMKSEEYSNALVELAANTDECFDKISSVTDQVATLQRRVKDLEERLDEEEQYSRRNAIEIKGIPTQENENVIDTVKRVGKAVGFEINDQMIDDCHRLKKGKGDKPPGIFVKFVRRLDKEEFLKKENAIKHITTRQMGMDVDADVHINESLSHYKIKLYTKAKEFKKTNGYKAVWHSDGNIFLRKSKHGQRIPVCTPIDLDNLRSQTKIIA